jgi:hypothetical protein
MPTLENLQVAGESLAYIGVALLVLFFVARKAWSHMESGTPEEKLAEVLFWLFGVTFVLCAIFGVAMSGLRVYLALTQ